MLVPFTNSTIETSPKAMPSKLPDLSESGCTGTFVDQFQLLNVQEFNISFIPRLTSSSWNHRLIKSQICCCAPLHCSCCRKFSWFVGLSSSGMRSEPVACWEKSLETIAAGSKLQGRQKKIGNHGPPYHFRQQNNAMMALRAFRWTIVQQKVLWGKQFWLAQTVQHFFWTSSWYVLGERNFVWVLNIISLSLFTFLIRLFLYKCSDMLRESLIRFPPPPVHRFIWSTAGQNGPVFRAPFQFHWSRSQLVIGLWIELVLDDRLRTAGFVHFCSAGYLRHLGWRNDSFL
jgi:hypothetical protein